jgi:hypothetical protein
MTWSGMMTGQIRCTVIVLQRWRLKLMPDFMESIWSAIGLVAGGLQGPQQWPDTG